MGPTPYPGSSGGDQLSAVDAAGDVVLTGASFAGLSEIALIIDTTTLASQVTIPTPAQVGHSAQLALIDKPGNAAAHNVSIYSTTATVDGTPLNPAVALLTKNGQRAILICPATGTDWTLFITQ